LSKTELETDAALQRECDRKWINSHHTYEDVFFMFPKLEIGRCPALNFDMNVYDVAVRHFKNKDPVHAPDQQVMFTMYKTMLARQKKRR